MATQELAVIAENLRVFRILRSLKMVGKSFFKLLKQALHKHIENPDEHLR